MILYTGVLRRYSCTVRLYLYIWNIYRGTQAVLMYCTCTYGTYAGG